ncbi:MAG TPA: bifunctional [glutamate--ammonia ligase]-adenylyl-L-tyrosine phosphorylase/[glutamate--ammonia-ligase] adenylyltransferase [Kofleriaceae bacterium]|jgi:glutamate-ammonia-ligase adenylyltransferase|nr:bifunctional [glutamate--ammonia ligase]-adenylyl-L-tyrosine phosphorylase/[glutamate--ammonia-ligase] adenylyltransferase [Kofleriaceae bacterium]
MVRPADLASGAPDAGDALRRAERLFDAASQSGLDLTDLDDSAVRVATLACQRAPYLAVLLTRDPHRLGRVAQDPYLRREKPLDQLIGEVRAARAGVMTGAELRSVLRRIRADELVRLGVRELDLGLDTEVGRELSRLSDVCFDAAIEFHDRELRARFGAPLYQDDDGVEREAKLAVIGMGKLGGEELNFASDVDVIYVYSSDQGQAGDISLHEYFAKLCTLVTGALSEVTEDDVVFRVDLRLRPEGAKGAIANSLSSMERYYETFGRPWERQAWIKARACAGDPALGAETLEMLKPFVFPRYTSPAIIDEVHALNRRIKRELVRPGPDAGFDLKNGVGGIREIEFFAQALQLIHGGKRPVLRCRGTLAALDALLFAGLVSDDEHLSLWRAYRWLRHAEHVLQLEAGLQTQTIPGDPDLQDLFARRLGYVDRHALQRILVAHTGSVARMFATLGVEVDEDRPDIDAILRGELSDEAESAALARLGFRDVTAATAELARARRRQGSPLSPAASERAARIGSALLSEIAASADPDQALRALGDLIARRGEAWSIWRLFDEQPGIVRLLGSLFGASAYLARVLVDTPELIDILVELGQSAPTRTVAQVSADLVAKLATADASDPEAVWSAVAEVKAAHVLRVGLADFAGALDPLAVCVELTAVAEACLQAALAIVEKQMPTRAGALAVLALGKLGGYELGYAADLDVVFVYDGGDDDEAVVHYSRLAQRLLGALRQRTPRGRLYEVDTRLRPSGSQGLLVSSLTAWRRYHEQSARLWERQALIKLRPVAGDPALGAEVARLAADTVYGKSHDPKAVADEIAAMREKIERELGGKYDLKTNPGGVIDVEFAAQFLQLVHGHAHAELRTTSTSAALRAAAALEIAPAGMLDLLDQGYRFLRGVEHRIRVVNDQPVHRLPESSDELDRLARRTGFPDRAALVERVERWQHDIRAAYRTLLGA